MLQRRWIVALVLLAIFGALVAIDRSGCVDINSASARQLDRIIHIGPVRAAVLIEKRPFGSVRELTRINGIARQRIRDIEQQGLACVEGTPD